MSISNDMINKLQILHENNLSIEDLVKEQLLMLEQVHDEFIERIEKENYERTDLKVAQIEIAQYITMKSLASKINLPIQKYDNAIKKIRESIMGNEFVNQYWADSDQI